VEEFGPRFYAFENKRKIRFVLQMRSDTVNNNHYHTLTIKKKFSGRESCFRSRKSV